jgi:TolA-binding protein
VRLRALGAVFSLSFLLLAAASVHAQAPPPTSGSHGNIALGGSRTERSAQVVNSKIGTDAERIRSSISKLTSNSVDELEKLISKLQELQEFLKSETSRVQSEIGSVLDGVGIIIEALAPWKTDDAASTRTNGRDKLKRWP